MTAVIGRSGSAVDTTSSPDLLVCGSDLAGRLRTAIDDEAWLDAFLAACGLAQLVDDRRHPDPLHLARAADYLVRQPHRAARIVGSTARLASRTGSHLPGSGRWSCTARALQALTVELAGLVLHRAPGRDLARLTAQVGATAGDLGPEPVRLPACLHAFDLTPDDVEWLVDAFGREHPAALAGPLCVLGVRTAGSYLAPLHAAALCARGAANVQTLSYRPGRPLIAEERARLAATVRSGGLILVVDDPPVSGTSLAATLAELARMSVPRAATVLLLSVFTDAPALPAALAGATAVVQPYPDWTVHQRLAEPAVAATLGRLLGPDWRVDTIRRTGPGDRPAAARRTHVRARFVAELTDRRDARTHVRHIAVEGAGLGWYSAPAAAAAARLAERIPRVYGLVDGLLYRDWLPEPLDAPAADDLAAAISGYVADRATRLAARRDPTPLLHDRDPAWDLIAALLARQLGPLAPLAQLWPLGPLVRRLLAVAAPAVTDGATEPRHWLPDPDRGGRLVKVDFHQEAFSHFDQNCYDPVFDLAGAADPAGCGLGALLRRRNPVDDERWLLYRLLHAALRHRTGQLDAADADRIAANALHEYLAGCYLADLPAQQSGPLCALDLDGVLETDLFGYRATSPTGALALRTLRAHGYRPVLATGRALPDAVDRCRAFGLPGAVAEYGAVVYDARTGAVLDQRTAAQRAEVDRARGWLVDRPGVTVDRAYGFAIRAYGPHGGPLPAATLAVLPAPDLRIVPGEGQTDLTVAALDKGTGLRRLAERLAAPGIGLAVGDTETDLPMLATAGLARAPANATPGLRRRGTPISRHGYQAGLAEAVADLLGHRPGGCPRCRLPQLPARTTALLTALGLRDGGPIGLAVRTARLAGYLRTGRVDGEQR